jgi:TolA-binding protein
MHDTSLPRQAKFFWIDLLNQCKTDQVRASLNQATCDRNTQKANKAIDTCIGLLKSRNFNQSIFDDIIYNRMPFTNETFTTTTTPPPTTTYPHYPFPENNAMYPGTIHVRHTRQILVAAAAVGGILGTFLGLFNDHEIKEIKHDLVHLEDQHNILTSIVQKHERELTSLHAELTALTNTVESLIMYNPTLVYAILQSNIKQMNRRIDILFQALQQLQHQRLAVGLLNSNQLDIIFKAALNAARSLQVNLIPNKPSDLFQLDASYIRQKNELLVILHIPCSVAADTLTLYEYVPFPYPLHRDPTLAPVQPQDIISLQDLANSNHFPATSAIYFKPDAKMIAIGRNTDLHTASYRLITDGDLASCVQKNHIYLCEDQQTLRKDLAGSCLGALYTQSELGVHIHCRIEIRPLRETTYQISATRHIAYSPTPFSTQIQCTNGSHFPVKLNDITFFELPPLCSIELKNSTITSVGSRRISPDPLIYNWDFTPTLLPAHLLDSVTHIDSQLKEIQTNLTHFRLSANDSITDEQFANLLHTHLTTPSASSAVLWSSLLTLLIIGLITFIFICMYLRRRRSFQYGPAPPTAPQNLSVIYNPPALAFEDEMAYIARTGNVNGSATATRRTSRAFPFQK